ncbi:hypothetical protein [Pseudomonas graminis]|uniref:Uncharacterized protein n=1 Tax=Pseudomonas graminis TaxID=158627 RepID=A0A6M8MTD5_9PSED|nr:hypothetical protein [Pseudomonas graminis]QKF51745.1 hypothetical protein FX982_02713 [Pseudomonas graminis]
MSNLSSKQTRVLASALARAVNQQDQASKKRLSTLANLSAPIAPVWWGGDPAFAGLVPRDEQEKDMPINIPQWPNGAGQGENDYLQFEWKLSTSGTWQSAQGVIPIAGPLQPGDFPMELQLSKSNFAVQGTFDLRYTVTNEAGNTAESDITQFIIDKTAPNYGQAPDAATFVDPVVISDGITQDYLDAHGGLELVIPAYQDEQPGDNLEVYVHEVGTSPTKPVFTGVIDSSRQIMVPADAFSGLLDGLIYVSYRLVDKVGNKGAPADNATAGLFLNPLPIAPLAAPSVPKIVDDSVLQLADIDLVNVALVEIDPYPNALENDLLVLTWGSAALKVTHRITDPFATIFLNVPYETILKPAYGTATTVLPTPVSYVVERGDKTFASDTATINVDFFVPGPVNPDRPDPVNPDLPRVTVKGAVSTVPNVLTDVDVGGDVTVTLKLYDPIGTGEEMVLFWGDSTKEVARLSPVVGTAGDDYDFVLDWDAIKDLPSSTAVPVFYTVGRITPPGNIEACVPTLVDVSAALPIKLANPEFPLAARAPDGTPILNCSTHFGPEQLVRVRIPANPNLQGGETLDFTWQCYTDRAGTQPAGAASTFSKTITAEQVADGFTFDQGPFDEYVLPTGLNGSIRVTYVSVTTPPMQGETLIRASGLNAAGQCPPNTLRAFGAGGCGC